ncbi:Actin-binding FH2 protein isoform 1 [Hibiscus syriacus]|uniref:Actin-binding FH2 protein isoform 1 n=1 Tax=Hibiscus syriacus TaxID=106335 RepID=A0A6A2XFB7_HIBSY|nr:Actin-binding FH2 protein isoform 1 [Hibiscus syriacus]
MEDKCHKGTQMEKASKILRTSIYKFLQSYQFFTTMAAILAFPYASSVLLSHLFAPSSSIVLPSIHTRLMAVFHALGFPVSSQLFTVLSFKISQTIYSSIFALPFTFTFFLVAKSSIFITLNQRKPAHSAALLLISFAFDLVEGFGLSLAPRWIVFISVPGFLIYSFMVANTIVVCNLALVSSAVEEQSNGGYLAIVKACVMLKGDAFSTGLTLTMAVNLALVAIEALFHYRIVKTYHAIDNSGDGGLIGSFSMATEGILIAYLYSIVVVLDAVMSFMFFKSCKTRRLTDRQGIFCCMIEELPLRNIERSHEIHQGSKTIIHLCCRKLYK